MNIIYLDLSPAYIPFLVQCTDGTGAKIDPTVDSLIIYEEGGADAAFDATTITGSPFDPAKVNAKTGLWGSLVAKSALTAGKWYIALWEMTVDGITTAKVERYFACNLLTDVIKTKTDNLPASPAAVGSNMGSVSSVTDPVTVGTNSDKTGYRLDASGSAAMTESYAAKGAAPTLYQLLLEMRALLAEKSITLTTLTAKKIDGTTEAATYTLDSATVPTSITRAT